MERIPLNEGVEPKKSFADTIAFVLSLIALLMSLFLIILSFVSGSSLNLPIGIIGLLVFFFSILGIVIGVKTLRYEGFSRAFGRAAIILGSLAIASLIIPLVFALIIIVIPGLR